MKAFWIIIAAYSLFSPAVAHACRGPFSNTYVVLTDPPMGLPKGAVLIRVELMDSTSTETGRRRARLLSGIDTRQTTILLETEGWTSCSAWGPTTGYVVGYFHQDRSVAVIRVVEYRERQYRTVSEEWPQGFGPIPDIRGR